MALPVALVQGASRGIGLQFCRNLLGRQCQVIATCRNPDTGTELQRLQHDHPDLLDIHKLDVNKEDEIAQLATWMRDKTNKLDLFINSAGILHPSGRGETSLKDVTGKGVTATLLTNTVGPLVMAKHLSPLLARGDGIFGRQSENPKNHHSGILVNMSAKVGSITDNGLGGWYSYRMSKAALNMATKTLSIELGRGRNKVICVALHPGTVDTDLSRPYHKSVKNLFTTQYSVDCLMQVIENLCLENSGMLLTYDGKQLPF